MRRGEPVVRARLALLLLLAACDQPSPPPAAPPALLRLWREGLDLAQVTTAPPPAGTGRVLFDLATEAGSAWQLVPRPTDSDHIRLVALRFEPGDTLPSDALAIVHTLDCRPGEALSLRVRARALEAQPGRPLVAGALLELRRPLHGDVVAVEDVTGLVDLRSRATHVLEGPWDPAGLDLRADLVVDRSTVQLALVLFVPQEGEAGGLAIDALQLVARPIAAHLAAQGEFPRLTRLDPRGAVRVALDRDWREGLLALPGTRYAFTLPTDARERRLDLSLGVAPRAAALEGGVRLRVEADGTLLLDETREAPSRPEEPAWRDTSLVLPAGTRTLTLSAEGVGAEPPLVVLGHPAVRAREPARRPNVVLISLDTLRPDRLGCYGGRGGVSPRLDALAAEGLRFTQAYSTTSYTLPSHASMLTGQWPARHGAVDRFDRLDPSCSPFLARMLADAGYATAAFTGGGYVSPTYGFAEGFDRYSENDPVWALDELRGRMLLETLEKLTAEPASAERALLRRYAAPSVTSWIERQQDGVPFFLFLHTYIAHNYAPDRQRLEQFGLFDEQGREEPFNHQDRERYNGGGPFPEGEAALRAAIRDDYLPYYDATIAMADEFVGGVLDALERAGLERDTLVLVTSDHGEEFGEHAFFGHGESLYEPAVRIPLIVRLPGSLAGPAGGARQPAVLDGPVSQVDFAPWILRLLALEPDPRMSSPRPFDATSLDPPARGTLVMELDTEDRKLSAVRDGPLKLIHLERLERGSARGVPVGGHRLFDVVQDALEIDDLGAGTAGAAQQRFALLEAFHAAAELAREGCAPVASEIDRETDAHLRALGY